LLRLFVKRIASGTDWWGEEGKGEEGRERIGDERRWEESRGEERRGEQSRGGERRDESSPKPCSSSWIWKTPPSNLFFGKFVSKERSLKIAEMFLVASLYPYPRWCFPHTSAHRAARARES
jgi:hypothetical protein